MISYGGGVRSAALLVMTARGEIDFRTFLFANTGDDSQDPAALDYLARPARPLPDRHAIELVEPHRTRRDGGTETLCGRL